MCPGSPHRIQDIQVHDMDVLELAQDGMKQVTVEATATTKILYESETFTVYTILAMCPITKTWWVVQKRYSEFHALRQKLLKTAKASIKTLPEVHQLLQPLSEFAFPKKHLRTDTPVIVSERKEAFNRLTSTLLAIRSECVVHILQAHNELLTAALNRVVDTIETFLQVPDHQKEGEVRHASISSQSPDESSSDVETSAAACDDDMCPICLYEFDAAPECTLHLGCSHVFHKDCVVPWLEQTMSCPMCRQQSTHGVL